MPIPNECFSDILSYLNRRTLYKCLFVNRYFCKITIPLIWRDPTWNLSLINTLLACLNEDEISSLIPYAIKFNNNQSPLFEYGKFIRKFNHSYCVDHIMTLFGIRNERGQDCRVQKLSNAIYHMIMRQGSNLQEFSMKNFYTDLPKFSTFTAYEPGITNLRSLKISFNTMNGCENCENTIEFLNMLSKSCNGIVDFNLHLSCPFPDSFVDIIKSQPLERIYLYSGCFGGAHSIPHIQADYKKVIYALEFRSETLKDLTFEYLKYLDFQDIDLSFMSKLDHLERLKLINCRRFLFTKKTKKLHLKELTLYYHEYDEYFNEHNDEYDHDYDYYCDDLQITEAMINPLLSEELCMLDLRNIVTPEAAKAVRESCPNLQFLQISRIVSESSILPICEISSLKVLKIELRYDNEVPSGLVEILGDNLKFVECLSLSFNIDLRSFEYFTDNCKADLKKWIIYRIEENSRKDYLMHVNNYQKVHNSLQLFGLAGNKNDLTNEELEIIDLLKNQGVDVKIDRWFCLNFI